MSVDLLYFNYIGMIEKVFYNFLIVIFDTVRSVRGQLKKNPEAICNQLKMKIEKLDCFPVIQQ